MEPLGVPVTVMEIPEGALKLEMTGDPFHME